MDAAKLESTAIFGGEHDSKAEIEELPLAVMDSIGGGFHFSGVILIDK